MGIHKPDIRIVVNYGIPSSLEAFYQQSGRAGRDGLPSESILLYGRGDANKVIAVAMQTHADRQVRKEVVERHVKTMVEYATLSAGCRRRFLLQYFGETPPAINPEICCDLCTKASKRSLLAISQSEQERGWMTAETKERRDLSDDVRILLRGIIDCGQWSGIGLPIDVICGNNGSGSSKRVTDFSKKASFGAGKHRSKDWWKALSDELLHSFKYIDTAIAQGGKYSSGNKQSFAYQRYFVTAQGKQFLGSQDRCIVDLSPTLARLSVLDRRKRAREPIMRREQEGESSTPSLELLDDLFNETREVPSQLANAEEILPCSALSYADLPTAVERKPSSISELSNLTSRGEKLHSRSTPSTVALEPITPSFSGAARKPATLKPKKSSKLELYKPHYARQDRGCGDVESSILNTALQPSEISRTSSPPQDVVTTPSFSEVDLYLVPLGK